MLLLLIYKSSNPEQGLQSVCAKNIFEIGSYTFLYTVMKGVYCYCWHFSRIFFFKAIAQITKKSKDFIFAPDSVISIYKTDI
jgi:hypothetical protein